MTVKASNTPTSPKGNKSGSLTGSRGHPGMSGGAGHKQQKHERRKSKTAGWYPYAEQTDKHSNARAGNIKLRTRGLVAGRSMQRAGEGVHGNRRDSRVYNFKLIKEGRGTQ